MPKPTLVLVGSADTIRSIPTRSHELYRLAADSELEALRLAREAERARLHAVFLRRQGDMALKEELEKSVEVMNNG